MLPWSETVALHHPLRQVHCTALAPLPPVWLERCDRRDKAAFERGRTAGEAALSEQLVRQRTEIQQLQPGDLDALRAVLPQVRAECEAAVVALALEAVAKLVAGLPVSRDMVDAAVKQALAQLEDTAGLTVLLHPDDLQLWRQTEAGAEAGAGSSPLVGLRVEASSEVTRGGCVVQTRFGVVDGRRETKLQVLRQALLA
jgi:flagellar biosynthesis/type III secretory pathway protein FliH